MRVFIVLEVMVLLTIYALEQKNSICSTLFYLFCFLYSGPFDNWV